jgi:hypothetical protein
LAVDEAPTMAMPSCVLLAGIRQRGRPERVGADQVAGDGVVVDAGRWQVDPMAAVSRDDVAGTGGSAADPVQARSRREGDATAPIAKRAGSGRIDADVITLYCVA